MLGRTIISDVKTGLTLGELVWDRRGSSRRGYSLSGFSVYINRPNINEITPTTRAKFNLYIQNIYRLHKLRKIRNETDIEIYSGLFITENKADFLFEGKKEFTFRRMEDFKITVMRDIIENERGNFRLSEKFLKREYNISIKEFKNKLRKQK